MQIVYLVKIFYSYLSNKYIGFTAFILSCGSVGSFGSLHLIFPSTESLEQRLEIE